MDRRDVLRRAIPRVSALLEARGVWHVLHYGTLLGIHRDGDVIAWDHDIDVLAMARDRQAVLAANEDSGETGIEFLPMRMPAARLAANPGSVAHFDPGMVTIIVDGVVVGDVFTPTLFADGVLRCYDLATETAWWPTSSFPHVVVAERIEIEWRGHRLFVPEQPERLLRCLYGETWAVPYRSVRDGGDGRDDATWSGESVTPQLRQLLGEFGVDAADYVGQPHWPRATRAAGPRGTNPRARLTSGSDWWHDLDEMVEHY